MHTDIEVDGRAWNIVIEQNSSGFRITCPDLPGCVATGSTFAEANIRGAIASSIETIREVARRLDDYPSETNHDE